MAEAGIELVNKSINDDEPYQPIPQNGSNLDNNNRNNENEEKSVPKQDDDRDGDDEEYKNQNHQLLDITHGTYSGESRPSHNLRQHINNNNNHHKSTEIVITPAINVNANKFQSKEHSFIHELKGKYLSLNVEGEIVRCRIEDISSDLEVSHRNAPTPSMMDELAASSNTLTKKEKKRQKVANLMKESTNQWLYTNDMKHDGDSACCDKWNQCTHGCINKFIAIVVILIQISAYIAITYFLVQSVWDFNAARENSCYGPNCKQDDKPCMVLTTGALVSVMLVGFLWADVINVIGVCKYKWWASLLCLLELLTAIVCGFLIGLYTDSDFDAIGGAIGILFVHDLDERVYASMAIISRRKKSATFKKLLAVFLWIFVSIGIGFLLACEFQTGSYIPTEDAPCLNTEFQCQDSSCIWNGFVCNGVEDCPDGSDEEPTTSCDYSLIQCPEDTFMCLSTGICLPDTKKCDGILDCEDGSDEGRSQNCAAFVQSLKCEENLVVLDENDNYHQNWTGQFKCNNGQCIDAQYACDGLKGDCVDGSDEYPFFDQSFNLALKYISACPYSQLITCGSTEVLCKMDGICISKNELCDGVEQCSDGADEKGCEYQCNYDDIASLTTFQCGGAIAAIDTINETIFLFDGTEESYSSSPVPLGILIAQLTAGDIGQCITNEWRCDGIQDCEDGSDEELCELLSCLDDEYQCPGTGECIPQDWLCDYIQDCDDGSDEDEDKVCTKYDKSFDQTDFCTATVGEGFYPCPNDAESCIPLSYFCDGYCDCSDISGCSNIYDEDPVVCAGYGITPSPNVNYIPPAPTTPTIPTIPTTSTPTTNIPTVSTTAVSDLYIGCNVSSVFGQITSIGGINSYLFVLPASGVNTVRFTTCTSFTAASSFDTKLYLYDDSDRLLVQNDDAWSCGLYSFSSTIMYSTESNGWLKNSTYRIDVGHYSDEGTGYYGIDVVCINATTSISSTTSSPLSSTSSTSSTTATSTTATSTAAAFNTTASNTTATSATSIKSTSTTKFFTTT